MREQKQEKKKTFIFKTWGQQIQDDGGADKTQVGAVGTDVSSTLSGDVNILQGQDQEPVTGSGKNLGGVVSKARTKVNHINVSEKVTVDTMILSSGI